MDRRLNLILVICVAGLIGVGVRWARQTGAWRAFWMGLVALGIFTVFLNRWFGFPFPGPIVKKSIERSATRWGYGDFDDYRHVGAIPVSAFRTHGTLPPEMGLGLFH